jgi:hypothetical protein
MYELVKEILSEVYFYEEADLDARAMQEIARFLEEEDSDNLDFPADQDEKRQTIRDDHTAIMYLYEYLTTSKNVIYGGNR